jgi:hypothetical protein
MQTLPHLTNEEIMVIAGKPMEQLEALAVWLAPHTTNPPAPIPLCLD